MFIIEPWHWLVFGSVLLISEMFLTTFATLWFGLAAIIVALIAWALPISLVVQIIIWLILSILLVIGWFRYIKPLAIDRTKAGLGGSVIVGETGMIIIAPTPQRVGTVRFSVPIVGATEWMCRTLGEPIVVGQRVVVTGIAGNELIVAPLKKPDYV